MYFSFPRSDKERFDISSKLYPKETSISNVKSYFLQKKKKKKKKKILNLFYAEFAQRALIIFPPY